MKNIEWSTVFLAMIVSSVVATVINVCFTTYLYWMFD